MAGTLVVLVITTKSQFRKKHTGFELLALEAVFGVILFHPFGHYLSGPLAAVDRCPSDAVLACETAGV